MILSLCLFWLAMAPCQAMAAGEPYASAYEWDDTLYIAALIPDMDIGRSQLRTGSESGRIQGDAMPERLSDSGSPVNLMLLVDCSTSMPHHKSKTICMAESLLTGLENYNVTVASFGTKFEVKNRNLTDWKSVKRALDRLKQTEQGTDICGGIAQAIQEMKTSAWSPGSFSHILLVTDGEPYYTNPENEELEAKQERETAALLMTQMERSPQIVLHSVSFATWKGTEETIQAVSSFGGVHQVASSDKTATTAGNATADFIAQLNLIQFPMPSEYYSEKRWCLGGKP